MNYRDGCPILNLSGTENRPWGFRGQRRVAAARLVAVIREFRLAGMRGICGCTLNGIFAAFPSLVIILWKSTELMQQPALQAFCLFAIRSAIDAKIDR